MIETYYNWAHSVGIHLYTIPTIIAAAIAAIIAVRLIAKSRTDK